MALNPSARNVVVRYDDQSAAVRERIVAFLRQRWDGMAAYNEADIDLFVRAVTPVMNAGQAQLAALTDLYLANVEAAVLGGAARPVGVPPSTVTTEALRGVPDGEVWRRPGVAVWTALANNRPYAAAVAIGLARAVDIAHTNLQLARTHTARRVLSGKDNVVGYRRVLSAGACELCQSSTHRFGKNELMPIHAQCTCSMVPVYRGGADPGDVSDGPPDSADNRGASTVREHGEIGPVLAAASDDFAEP